MLRSRFVGCLVGSALGDAIGNSFESLQIPETQKLEDFSGKWSDDTHMMIGVTESLIENEGFDAKHMALTFIKNYEQEPWRGYGPGPPRVFKLIQSGVPWNVAATKLFGGRGSYGNGAAMRVAPIGLLFHTNPRQLRAKAYSQSKITHTHRLAKEGAALQAYAIALAVKSDATLKLDPIFFLERLNDFARNEIYIQKLNRIGKLLNEKNKSKIVVELGNGVEAHNSVPAAIYSFLCCPTSFEQSVLFAVGLGGDRDTIGAMTGAISGAYHGVGAIPKMMNIQLEKRDFIKELGEQLYNVFCQKQLSKL